MRKYFDLGLIPELDGPHLGLHRQFDGTQGWSHCTPNTTRPLLIARCTTGSRLNLRDSALDTPTNCPASKSYKCFLPPYCLQAVSRLSQQYVDLHRALSARSAVDQQEAVERLIAAALDANGLTAADVSAPGEVERLDEQAWLVQEQVKRGSATQEQYEAAFRRARAASAVQSLAGPQVALEDAAYEAVHALPADVDALPIISG